MCRQRWVLTLLAVLVGSLAIASLAQAHPGSRAVAGAARSAAARSAATAAASSTTGASASQLFGCRAGVAPVYLGSATTPLTDAGAANEATNPCNTATSTAATVPLEFDSAGTSLGSVGPAGAFTYESGAAGSLQQPGAAAAANVQAINIGYGGYTLTASGPFTAQASVQCQNNQPVFNGSSNLTAANIDGQAVNLSSGQQTFNLGAGAYIAFNEQVKTATSMEENLIDIHLATGVQIIVGQAYVSLANADSCANTAPTSGSSGSGNNGLGATPPNLQECPTGSSIDVSLAECVIYGSNGQVLVVVSKPYHGPSGGVVMTIPAAKKKYGSDPCLTSKGQQNWALVATKRGGKVQGTPKSDRILGLGGYERIAGLAGNDCIYGKGGNQSLYDGNGKDKVYAGGGHNRIALGNGNNYVNGQYIRGAKGTDWITDGNGNDTIYGGKAATRIDAGTGRDHIHGGPANDRIWIASGGSTVTCGGGKKNTFFGRGKTALYAAKHGCQKMHYLPSR